VWEKRGKNSRKKPWASGEAGGSKKSSFTFWVAKKGKKGAGSLAEREREGVSD